MTQHAGGVNRAEQPPPAVTNQGVEQGHSALYAAVIANLRRCAADSDTLSDFTAKAIELKKPAYEEHQLCRMLAPGNPVSSRTRDIYYHVDATLLDLNDSIIARLLEIGESDFGAPSRTVPIGDKRFSSIFLHSVAIARRVIKALEANGTTKPRVLEVGGGLGLVQALLRDYFGSDLTLFAIDVPQVLQVQEWYLRNRFPEVPTAFKASAVRVAFVPGGFNFINAFAYEGQDFEFDAAINVESFSEMRAQTANQYIRFIERNLADRGTLSFSNGYGQSPDSVAEPSDYDFDPYWKVESAELLSPIEALQPDEQYWLSLRRDKRAEDPAARRFVLRLFWQFTTSGVLPSDGSLVEALFAAARRCAADELPREIASVLGARNLKIADGDVEPLLGHARLDSDTFFRVGRVGPRAGLSHSVTCDTALRGTLGQLVEVMREARQIGDVAAAHGVARVRANLISLLDRFAETEFWTAWVLCVLFPLGDSEAATSGAIRAARATEDPIWRLRFATLLARYGQHEPATGLVRTGIEDTAERPYLSLKAAEILAAGGALEEARSHLRTARVEVDDDGSFAVSYSKTALRLGISAPLKELLRVVLDEGNARRLWDLCAFALCERGVEDGRALVEDVVEAWASRAAVPADAGSAGALLWWLGDKKRGEALFGPARAALNDDYYQLCGAGHALQMASADEAAAEYLERSSELRPDAFVHQDFIGDVYLQGRRVEAARRHYARAAELKPYLLHLQGKAAFCGLPENLRDGGLFGTAADLSLLFQRRQGFYHDSGPSFR